MAEEIRTDYILFLMANLRMIPQNNLQKKNYCSFCKSFRASTEKPFFCTFLNISPPLCTKWAIKEGCQSENIGKVKNLFNSSFGSLIIKQLKTRDVPNFNAKLL